MFNVNSAPKVSVIIPTYNRADMVGDAIQSVIDQTYHSWELIIVDDGSQDNTSEVVAQFSDPRIRYIYQENKKLPAARNTGIRASSGEYLVFLDSDDLFMPDKLRAQESFRTMSRIWSCCFRMATSGRPSNSAQRGLSMADIFRAHAYRLVIS